MLRKNSIILLRHLLCYSGSGLITIQFTQLVEIRLIDSFIAGDESHVEEDLVTAVTGGIVDLLKDSEAEVRTVAAANLGQIVAKYTK